MKNKTLIIVLILLISFATNAQKTKTVLYYKNGDSIVGFSKGVHYDLIKFSNEKKGKYRKKDITNIKKVILYYKNGKVEYHHLYVKKKRKMEEFYSRLVLKGPINYYIYSSQYTHNFTSFKNINIGNGKTLNQMTQERSNHTVNIIYLKNKKSKHAVYISDLYFSLFGAKIFRKNAATFFNDCPKLAKKIKSKELKKPDIIEIVEFYNNNCN